MFHQHEVLDELLKVEEAKEKMKNFLIPERDTSETKPASKPDLKAPRSRLKGKIEPRIDTGPRQGPKKELTAGKKAQDKENIPQKAKVRIVLQLLRDTERRSSLFCCHRMCWLNTCV